MRSRVLVVAAWFALAVIANLIFALVPKTESDTVAALPLPDAKTAAQMAEAFPGADTNAIAYLVLDGRRALGPADEDFYETAVKALRADTDHVGSVLAWWSDELTAPIATGSNDQSAVAMVWLVGEAGTAEAQESLEAARAVVKKLPPAEGLRARVIAPATTGSMPLHMAAWQGAVVIAAAAVIAVLLLLRMRRSVIAVVVALLTAQLTLAVAWPLSAMLLGNGSVFSVFSGTVAAVLAIGTITASTVALLRRKPVTQTPDTETTDDTEPLAAIEADTSAAADADTPAPSEAEAPAPSAPEPPARSLGPAGDRRAYREMLPALAVPGGCIVLLTVPLLFAATPALQGVGAASLGVVVALAASLTLLPALVGFTHDRSAGPPAAARGAAWTPPRSIPRPAVLVAVVLAVCAVPVAGMQLSLAEEPVRTNAAQFLPGNPLPDVVTITSSEDLRNAGGLIAIDRVTRRIMDIPGVTLVQSAAWPGGVPWNEASLTAALGRLSDQMNQQASTFLPQLNAIKQMQATMDQVSNSFDELQQSMNTGLAGVSQMQQVMDEMMASSRNIQNTTTQMSAYLDPVRTWAAANPDCPADAACSAVRKVIDPLDSVMADATVLFNGTDRIAAISNQTLSSFDTAPAVMSQMRGAFDQMRALMDNMQKSVEGALPQMTQLSLFLRNLTSDFTDTGEGGFYLSNKQLSDPSYQGVRRTMFSPDGTVTRLFVFSDGVRQTLDAAARAEQLQLAAGGASKFGSLVGSDVTVSGAAGLASDVRSDLIHDAVLLAAGLLAILVGVVMWRGARSGFLIGIGLAGAYLAALGLTAAAWQYLLGRELISSVPLVAFALLAACGVPYLIGAMAESTGAASAIRSAGAALVALGAVFGVGLVIASGASFNALGQVGSVLVIGLGALVAVAQVCIPATAPRDPAARSPEPEPEPVGAASVPAV